MMGYTFSRDKLEFEQKIRAWSRVAYEKIAERFQKYDLELPKPEGVRIYSGDNFDTYRFTVTGAVVCFKACLITLGDEYTNDYDFCIWSENALYALNQITPDDKAKLTAIENEFRICQLKKHNELIAVQTQLRETSKILSLNYDFINLEEKTESKTHEEIFQQNKQLIKENNKLYNAIVEAGRKKAEEYNDSALKAIILSLSMEYINRDEPEILENAKSAYQSHLNPTEEISKTSSQLIKPLIKPVQLPEPGKIYPFLEPEKEFVYLEQPKNYHSTPDSITLSDQHMLTIKKLDAANLHTRVTRLSTNHEQSQNDQKTWLGFLGVIKKSFGFIWKQLITILKKAERSLEYSDFAVNTSHILDNQEISRTAKLIHQFNSRPSPLVHIIYDKSLTEMEKVELLMKLAQAQPYRFAHEQPESRKNIEIPSGSLAESCTLSPEGSPLHHAIKHGTPSMVDILLSCGADTNAKGICIGIKNIDYQEVTPLHMAVEQGDIEKVRLLIRYSADVNIANKAGQTPLHVVSNEEILELLIENGADINRQDSNGQTPLHFAVKYGNHKIVNALVKQKNLQVDLQDKIGNTALHLVAATNFEMSQSQHSYTFIDNFHNNKKEGNLESLEKLIEKGADVNKRNKSGYTPLHMAVLDGYGTIDWENMQEARRKPLDYSHIENQVRLLCNHGADVNAESYKEVNKNYNDSLSSDKAEYHSAPGTTPLLALYTLEDSLFTSSLTKEELKRAKEERLNVAKYLIDQRKANFNLIYEKDVILYRVYQEKGNNLLHQCAKFNDINAFRYFANLGLDPNFQYSEMHETPFHVYMNFCIDYYTLQNNGSGDIKQILECGVIDKTIKIKIEINKHIHNLSFELRSKPSVVAAILNNDNVISQTAKNLGLNFDGKNGMEIICKVWENIFKQKSNNTHSSLEITVPLYTIAYAEHHQNYLSASPEVKKIVEEHFSRTANSIQYSPRISKT